MKAIKFNLQYGDKQFKTLAELKEYGNIDMLLETLNNGMLERWLNAHGHIALAKEIQAIDKSNNQKVCDLLCKIFFDEDASTAQKAVAELFALRQEEAMTLNSLKDLKQQRDNIIADYHGGYNELINYFKNNQYYYAGLKAGMTVLYEQYRKLLRLDSRYFYDVFKEYPLVMLAFMANEQLRNYINYDGMELYKYIIPQLVNKIPNIKNALDEAPAEKELDALKRILKNIHAKWTSVEDGISEDGKKDEDISDKEKIIVLKTFDELEMFKSKYNDFRFVCFFYDAYNSRGGCKYEITTANNAQYYSDRAWYVPLDLIQVPHVKMFAGETDGYWKDIEPKGKKFMIISMVDGNMVRSAGKTGEERKADDVNGKFIFTDGIDYKSASNVDQFIYMEV